MTGPIHFDPAYLTTQDLLDALLDATPLPPTDAGPEHLIAEFETVYARRQHVLDQLRGVVIDGFDKVLVRELVARQDAWRDALAGARETLCRQRAAITKTRAYAH
jgi:hypothetical protein